MYTIDIYRYKSQNKCTQNTTSSKPQLWCHVVNKKTFTAKSSSKKTGLLSHTLARKGSGPGACSPSHQQQVWRRQHICCLGLGGLFIYYVWEKKDLRCFERIFKEYERGGKGDGGSSRIGEQPVRKKCLLL